MDLFEDIIREVFLTEGIASVTSVNDAINGLHPVEIRYVAADKKNTATGRRIIYPVAYGLTKAGNPVVRAFEPYGDTYTKVPAWKFFLLDGLKHWRILKNKTFKGKNLEGFNKDGDLSMSAVYNIANIDGKPKDFTPQTIKVDPITKTDISQDELDKEINKETNPDKMYNSKEIIDKLLPKKSEYKAKDEVDDMLGDVKSQIDNKTMVSPSVLAQIEKDNARKKLAKAKRDGIKLDNEQELLDIIKRKPATRTFAPQTQPITKDKIINTNSSSKNGNGVKNIPTSAIYKDDLGNDKEYNISQDTIDRIKKEWGF